MSESNIKLHFRAIYVPRKLYKSFHFLLIAMPCESCHFMPFKWGKHKVESTHTNHIRRGSPALKATPPSPPKKTNKKTPTLKQLPYCYRCVPPSQLLHFPQELISDGPDAAYSEAKSTLPKTGFRFFSPHLSAIQPAAICRVQLLLPFCVSNCTVQIPSLVRI